MEIKDIFIAGCISLLIVIIAALLTCIIYKHKNKSESTIYEFERDDLD